MRIVVLDGFTLNPGDNPWDDLGALGELEVFDRTPPEEIVARASGAPIVLTNKTPLDAASIAALPELRFIGVLATGYNVVDVAAAQKRGIVVSNVPEYGTDSTAQHAIALMLELSNAVGVHDRAVHSGDWSRSPDFCFWQSPLVELAGLTMGIIGFGRIGRRVGEIAHALGMRVMAAGRPGSRAPEPPPFDSFAWASIDEVFARSDVVSLHFPLTAATHHFVGRDMLARMKPTAFLINAGRGGLVDELALVEALEEGTIAGAAFDVAVHEPPPPDWPLLRAPRCILTPHIAWAALAARRRLMGFAVENVRAFLAGKPVNVVA